jgi:hydroxymethylglutaryl-CoA lyase
MPAASFGQRNIDMNPTIHFNEVVTRDGFQSEANFIPTEQKIALINALSQCGFKKIEVTSFTSHKAIPMLRDAKEVMLGINRLPGVEYTVLIPNLKGAQNALEFKPSEMNLVMSSSQSHNASNMRMSMEDSFSTLSEVIKFVDQKACINVSLSTAFGCPMEGAVNPKVVEDLIARFTNLGVGRFTICDTTGMANPKQVAEMADRLLEKFSDHLFVFHFHNTRGMGLANVLAAIDHGITHFDGSLGGLGGCPYAPGATGNICSEDAIHMVQEMGYPTNMHLDLVLRSAEILKGMINRPLPGQIVHAGKSSRLHPISNSVKEILSIKNK